MLKGWLLSFGLVLVWYGAQIALYNWRRVPKKFVAMSLLFVPTFPLLAILYLATPPDLGILPRPASRTPVALGLSLTMFIHVLMYCTGVMFFFHFDRSITLRILSEFEQAEGRYLSLARLQEMYNLDVLLRGRLEALVRNNYVTVEGDRYRLTPKGWMFARVMGLSRKVFPLKML